MTAMRVRRRGMVVALVTTAAVIWAIKVAAWKDGAASPVLSTTAATVLHAIGYAAAWMAFGLLAKALLYQLKHSHAHASRVAPALGVVLASSGVYWVWLAMAI